MRQSGRFGLGAYESGGFGFGASAYVVGCKASKPVGVGSGFGAFTQGIGGGFGASVHKGV